MIFNRKGFSGLEAAIVLIAFVIVASIFSYIVINMGFFSTSKVKTTVMKGTTQASTVLQIVGDVIVKDLNNSDDNYVNEIVINLRNTGAKNPIDVRPGKTIVTFTYETGAVHNSSVYNSLDQLTWLSIVDDNSLLDEGEQVEIRIPLYGVNDGKDVAIPPGESFKIEVIPPEGVSVSATCRVPANFKKVAALPC